MPEFNSTIVYRAIPGFPGYRVGSDGSVWSCWNRHPKKRRMTDRWKLMKATINTKGYLRMNLTPPEGGCCRSFAVHRLVLTAFVGPCPTGMECRHLNGIKTDNRLENLAWGTNEENVRDRRKHANWGPRVKPFTYAGQTLPLAQWASVFRIPYPCLLQRIKKLGMTFEEAIARPYHGVASNGAHWTKVKRQQAASQQE